MVNSCSRRYPAADMPWSGAEESHLISSHLTLRLRHCGWFVARHTSFFLSRLSSEVFFPCARVLAPPKVCMHIVVPSVDLLLTTCIQINCPSSLLTLSNLHRRVSIMTLLFFLASPRNMCLWKVENRMLLTISPLFTASWQ